MTTPQNSIEYDLRQAGVEPTPELVETLQEMSIAAALYRWGADPVDWLISVVQGGRLRRRIEAMREATDDCDDAADP